MDTRRPRSGQSRITSQGYAVCLESVGGTSRLPIPLPHRRERRRGRFVRIRLVFGRIDAEPRLR